MTENQKTREIATQLFAAAITHEDRRKGTLSDLAKSTLQLLLVLDCLYLFYCPYVHIHMYMYSKFRSSIYSS